MNICDQAHICKTEDCCHKVPHDEICAGPAPCYRFQLVAGKYVDPSTAPVSACIPVVNGKYYTKTITCCTHCGGRGYTEEQHEHEVPALPLPIAS
jgi:hypothetical protein